MDRWRDNEEGRGDNRFEERDEDRARAEREQWQRDQGPAQRWESQGGYGPSQRTGEGGRAGHTAQYGQFGGRPEGPQAGYGGYPTSPWDQRSPGNERHWGTSGGAREPQPGQQSGYGGFGSQGGRSEHSYGQDRGGNQPYTGGSGMGGFSGRQQYGQSHGPQGAGPTGDDQSYWRGGKGYASSGGRSSGLNLQDRGRRGKAPRTYQRADERIRDEIVELVVRDTDVDASDVDVQVKDGEVTLSGTVESRSCKRELEDVVERVFGVKDVHNQMKVRHGLMSELGDKLFGREKDRNETPDAPAAQAPPAPRH